MGNPNEIPPSPMGQVSPVPMGGGVQGG
jgi:hypothetical protein